MSKIAPLSDYQETWTWVAGNENRGCIGCHEDRELSPPNVLVDAVINPANDLTVQEGKRTVDFKNQVAPIIKNNCATNYCHVPGKIYPNLQEVSSDITKSSSRSVYEALVKPSDRKQREQYVIPGNAKESPVIWHILNFQQSLNPNAIELRETSKLLNMQLSAQEKKMIIEWIDCGAFWDLSALKVLNSHKKTRKNRVAN